MPHDCKGHELKAGDAVLVRCTVKSVSAGTDHCNVTLETREPCHPSDHKTTICLNTRQCLRCGEDAE